jgi:hypothetical protein
VRRSEASRLASTAEAPLGVLPLCSRAHAVPGRGALRGTRCASSPASAQICEPRRRWPLKFGRGRARTVAPEPKSPVPSDPPHIPPSVGAPRTSPRTRPRTGATPGARSGRRDRQASRAVLLTDARLSPETSSCLPGGEPTLPPGRPNRIIKNVVRGDVSRVMIRAGVTASERGFFIIAVWGRSCSGGNLRTRPSRTGRCHDPRFHDTDESAAVGVASAGACDGRGRGPAPPRQMPCLPSPETLRQTQRR